MLACKQATKRFLIKSTEWYTKGGFEAPSLPYLTACLETSSVSRRVRYRVRVLPLRSFVPPTATHSCSSGLNSAQRFVKFK